MDVHIMIRRGASREEIERQFMTLDSEFRFKCRKCGKCCKHQDTVLFNSRDVFNIAKKLGKHPEAVINEYAEVYIGQGSYLPVVHMVPRGLNKVCPFLKDERCSIHDSKPTVCALFPLGRVITGELDPKDSAADGQDAVRYILNDIDCGSRKRVNTVREWLARFNIPEHDEFFLLWSRTVATLGSTMHNMEDRNASGESIRVMQNSIYELLYLNYDTSKDFMPQFQQASKTLVDLCHTAETVINGK